MPAARRARHRRGARSPIRQSAAAPASRSARDAAHGRAVLLHRHGRGVGSHRDAPHARPERAIHRRNESDLAQARRRSDERAHLGARNPFHRRQVVHLFHREPQRCDLGSAAVRARECLGRSLQGRMERAGPPRDGLGQLLARRHHVQTHGKRYFVWTQRGRTPEEGRGTNIYIAQMDSPTTITGKVARC